MSVQRTVVKAHRKLQRLSLATARTAVVGEFRGLRTPPARTKRTKDDQVERLTAAHAKRARKRLMRVAAKHVEQHGGELPTIADCRDAVAGAVQ